MLGSNTMKKLRQISLAFLVVGVLAMVCFMAPGTSFAFDKPDPSIAPAPDFDIRGTYANATPSPLKEVTISQKESVSGLRAAVQDLSIRWSSFTNAPSRIYSLTGTLTEPSTASAKDIATDFLTNNLSIFNLLPEDILDIHFSRNFTTKHNGVTHLTIQQRVNGIDIFECTLKINIDSNGCVLNISGEPVNNIHASVNTADPVIDSSKALALAVKSSGVSTVGEVFSSDLVYFPLQLGNLRLAWDITFEDADTPNVYRSLVDAVDGAVLWRACLTDYATNAQGDVYTSDSPDPNSPTGSSVGIVPRVDAPFNGLEFFPLADPHADWWNGSPATWPDNETRSNNVSAHEDRDADNDDNEGIVQAPTGNEFDFAVNLNQNPNTYTDFSVVQLFYWCNRIHDIFYRHGFDEAAGNFQVDNFSLGGSGGDPVQADAQDGHTSEICNAHMATPGDGTSPRLRTGECPVGGQDGALDNGVVIHEYTHGLTRRLTDVDSGTAQGGGLSEGTSDLMAIILLAEEGDDFFGRFEIGQWYFGSGIRVRPYSVDQTIFDLTYADIDSANHGLYYVGAIWANTIWIAHANLVWKHGFQTGHNTMIRLYIDGMKLSPSSPDLLDMRDAILQADNVSNGGMNQCLLWDAFARMGMGYSALSTGEDDDDPLESFDTPSTCTSNIQYNAPLDFGNVCMEDQATNQIEIFNNGTGDLIVYNVSRVLGSSDISVDPNPATPAVVSAGSQLNFTVRCEPTSTGSKSTVIRIESSDLDEPEIDLTYTSNTPAPIITTLIPNNGDFGDVCQGDFKDLMLTLSNSGDCNLTVSSIFSLSSQFIVAGIVSLPMVIGPGASVDVPIRFAPTSLGPKNGIIVILSDDLTSPTNVTVSGNAPEQDIRVTGSTDFGDVCAETQAEKIVSVCNVGPCNLNVMAASINCADFTLINNPFPAVVSPDSCVDLVIRFTPTSAGPKTCDLTITSDDPDTPTVTLTITANTPMPSIDVPFSLSFSPTVLQSVGACSSYEPLPISNTGSCNLTINSIVISDNAFEYSLSGLPSSPIILEPGHIVGEGDLNTVFEPDTLARDRTGEITVNYVSDPITGATTDVQSSLCGEGVMTGARILVTYGGSPVQTVNQIMLLRINANRNNNRVDTVDVARNLDLQTITQVSPCSSFQFHREYGTISNPVQLLPGSYQATAMITIGKKKTKKSVAFDVNTCDFNPTIIIDF